MCVWYMCVVHLCGASVWCVCVWYVEVRSQCRVFFSCVTVSEPQGCAHAQSWGVNHSTWLFMCDVRMQTWVSSILLQLLSSHQPEAFSGNISKHVKGKVLASVFLMGTILEDF